MAHKNDTPLVTLSEIKHELATELERAVTLYFAPIAAVVRAVRGNFHEVGVRAAKPSIEVRRRRQGREKMTSSQ